jgi:transcriptional regulator with PAS, ATPase and Fis domain
MIDFSNIIGESASIKQVLSMLERVVQHPEVSILVCGETGTGKEVVARTIHQNSANRDQLFVEMNCAGIPEQLLESELFGYERGAFTGADHTKKGLLELANKGTLLLDEIGHMSMRLQAKLLKAIEEKSFRRLGGEKEIQVQVRIVACTNVDLEAAIAAAEFRQDLYYRLNEIQIDLPPLRDRDEDVLLLAGRFIDEFAVQYGLSTKRLSPKTKELLRRYRWPGNVRELRNAIKRAMIICDADVLEPDAIPISVRSSNTLENEVEGRKLVIPIPPEGIAIDEVESTVINYMLREMGWNKNQTARVLRISYPRLLRKISKYGLRPEVAVEVGLN